MYRFLGRSVVMVPDYNSWIPQKKILGPVFSKQYVMWLRFLQGLVPKFNSIVDCHLKKLQPLADGKTSTPLAFYIQNVVLSIVSEIRQSIVLRLFVSNSPCTLHTVSFQHQPQCNVWECCFAHHSPRQVCLRPIQGATLMYILWRSHPLESQWRPHEKHGVCRTYTDESEPNIEICLVSTLMQVYSVSFAAHVYF